MSDVVLSNRFKKDLKLAAKRGMNLTLLRCHPTLAGTTPPSRDMPTHTGFANGDALRCPYCAKAVRFALKGPFPPAAALHRPQHVRHAL